MTTSQHDTEFSGLPFNLALGEVYGLRVWRMDEYGRLRARSIDSAPPWRPGINTAACHGNPLSMITTAADVIDPSGQGRTAVEVAADVHYANGGMINPGGYSFTAPSIPVRYRVAWDDGTNEMLTRIQIRQRDHAPVPSEECRCGFYAYTEPHHEETANGGSGHILGVIRGTGRTLIGTRGFRCEKAEIIALRDPTGGQKKHTPDQQNRLEKLRRVYPDVPILPNRAELLQFAPIESMLPDPSTDEFWTLP